MSNAKEALRAKIADAGWVVDTTRTVSTGRFTSSPRRIQDPNAFVKRAASGGHWALQLVFTKTGMYELRDTNTLKKVEVQYYAPGQDVDERQGVSLPALKKPRQSYSSWGDDFWNSLNGPEDKKERTLRERVEVFVADPDLGVWNYLAERHRAELEREEIERKKEELRAARARPLPVTVGQSDWNRGSWKSLVFDMEYAAKAIHKADGTSDLPKLVAEAQQALDAIVNALTDEASLEFAEHMNVLSDAERM